jgi:hypothetical protein
MIGRARPSGAVASDWDAVRRNGPRGATTSPGDARADARRQREQYVRMTGSRRPRAIPRDEASLLPARERVRWRRVPPPVERERLELGSMRFQDKVLFVTGGASELGAASARRFADEGAVIAVADIDTAAAEALAATLPDAVTVTVNTAIAASVERAIAQTVDRYGRVDVIFNNAGIESLQQPLHEMTLDNWNRVMAVNGAGVFHVPKYGIDAMLQTGGGAIVNTSSTSGLVARGEHLAVHVRQGGRRRLDAVRRAQVRRTRHPHQRGRARRRADTARQTVHRPHP